VAWRANKQRWSGMACSYRRVLASSSASKKGLLAQET